MNDLELVFSKADSIEPDPEHLDWWQNNSCNLAPINKLNHSYFALSQPISSLQSRHDPERASAVTNVIAALESYASQNNSYNVAGSGWRDQAIGWFHLTGGNYIKSIANELLDQGFLSSPAPKDPEHPNPGTFSTYDFLVYRCLDRVAVFSKADTIEPEPEHLDWWQNNNCNLAPINKLNHTYFHLSKSLDFFENEHNLSNYTLVFEDNFDGTSLNSQKWNSNLLWGPYLPINNEEQLYVDTLGINSTHEISPFSFDGETLTISAIPTSQNVRPPARPDEADPIWAEYPEYRFNGPNNNTPGYRAEDVNYLSGIITSYDSFKMTHGYVEARVKLPAGRGLWPAFWLLNTHYVEDAPEIDVMEFLGQNTEKVYHTYHYFDIDNNWAKISTPSYETQAASRNINNWTDDYHTFGVAWTPKEIIWYVDGIETKRITDEQYKISGQAMYLIANLAVGGSWPGSPDENTIFPADYKIDYIRAYKRKNSPSLNLASDYQLMFSDEFNGSALDPLKWNTSYLWGPYLTINQEEQYYVDALGTDKGKSYSPFSIEQGVLSITADHSSNSGSDIPPVSLPEADSSIWAKNPEYRQGPYPNTPHYTSGVITSYDSFKFVNGYAEIRAKVPSGDGLWPAFWLLNAYYVGSLPEIDVMEILGENPNLAYHTFHRSNTNGEQISTQFTTTHNLPVEGYAEDFHTYGVRWQPGEITWYVDGNAVHTYTDPEGQNSAYQLMYVIANLAVGGNFNSVPVDPSLFPATFDIDYIRVYQEKDNP